MNLVQNISQIFGYGFPMDAQGTWLLGHLTKGDFNAILGKWVPQFPALLNPGMPNGIFSQGFPLLPLVQNLQMNSSGILNNMVAQFGNTLNVRAGFLNNLPITQLVNEIGHTSGLGVDVSVSGFQSNPALIAKDVQQMLGGNASGITMVFNTASSDGHFHIDINPPSIMGSNGNYETQISTVNLSTGETVAGSFEWMNGYV